MKKYEFSTYKSFNVSKIRIGIVYRVNQISHCAGLLLIKKASTIASELQKSQKTALIDEKCTLEYQPSLHSHNFKQHEVPNKKLKKKRDNDATPWHQLPISLVQVAKSCRLPTKNVGRFNSGLV